MRRKKKYSYINKEKEDKDKKHIIATLGKSIVPNIKGAKTSKTKILC